jgi:hypothetical protein
VRAVQGKAVEGAKAHIVGSPKDVSNEFVSYILGLGAVEKERKDPPVLLVGAVVSGDLNEEGFVVSRGGGQEGEKAGGGFAWCKVGRKNIADGIRSIRSIGRG